MHGWAADVIGAVGEPEPNPQGYIDVFFAHSSTSKQAGQQVAGRIHHTEFAADVHAFLG